MKAKRIFGCELLNRCELLFSLRGKRAHAFPNMAKKKLVLPLVDNRAA